MPTFCSILVSRCSRRLVSEQLEMGEALREVEGVVKLSARPASPISSSAAFSTFSTSVVMLHRDAEENFCCSHTHIGTHTHTHTHSRRRKA